jgi:hypothetical protein
MWATWQVAIVGLVSFLSGVACVFIAALVASGNDHDRYPPCE